MFPSNHTCNGSSIGLVINDTHCQRVMPNKKDEPGKRPAGRPKLGGVPPLPIDGLHLEWDSNKEVREGLRAGGLLVEEGKTEDIPSCCGAGQVLQPLLTRMSMIEHKPLPCVELLRDEVEKIYVMNKRGKANEDVPDVIGASWRLRKLLGFIKMKCRRKEVSSVPFLQ